MPILIILLTSFALYIIQKIIYVQYWSNGLETKIQYSKKNAMEGDTVKLIQVITNRKRIPLITLQIKYSISRHLRVINNNNNILTDKNYHVDIFSILGYEEIRREHEIECRKRGYYSINRLEVICYDLFFTQKLVAIEPQNSSLYVYPKAVDTKLFAIPFKQLMGTVLSKRYNFEDPFEFRSIRDYELNDPMKSINWKASARSGNLKVNEHNFTSSQEITLLLDLHSDSNWKYETLVEESIKIAFAYSNECIRNGIPVKLITKAEDIITRENISFNAGAGLNHADSISKGLARIDESRQVSSILPDIENELRSKNRKNTIYVLISKSQNQKLLELFNKLCIKNKGSQWISPLHPDMEFKKYLCPNAYAYKWEVTYAQ